MTKTDTAQTPDDVLVQVQAELGNLRILRAEKQREVDAIVARMQVLERRMSAIQVATTTLTHWVPPTAEEEWRENLTAWRKVLCDELLALPEQLRTDHEVGTQKNLTLSIGMIDGVAVVHGTGYDLTTLRLGQLMREGGYEPTGADASRNFFGTMPWFGSWPDVERRIARIKKERDDAQAQLDAPLRKDTERETPRR